MSNKHVFVCFLPSICYPNLLYARKKSILPIIEKMIIRYGNTKIHSCIKIAKFENTYSIGNICLTTKFLENRIRYLMDLKPNCLNIALTFILTLN